MKRLGTKPLGLALVAAALFLGVSSRAFGYVISAYPDSLSMRAAIGTSTDAYIIISDGRDTTQNLTKGTVHVYLSGSSQFTMMTDSVLQFAGDSYIQVRYSPTDAYAATGEVQIVGDSNTVYVPLVGRPVSHYDAEITLSNYDSVHANQEDCQIFGIYNSNPDTIWVTQVILSDDPRPGTQWSLANMPTLPILIPGHASWSIGQLCAYMTSTDDSSLTGSIEIDYTYDTGTYSATAQLFAERSPLNSTCVTPTGSDYFPAPEGGGMTRTFTLTNTADSSVYLDSPQMAGEDSAQFTVNSPAFPLVLPKDSSVELSITFTAPSPSTKDNYYATFEAAVYGTSPDGVACNPLTVQLWGSVEIPVVDSITLDVPPGSSTLSITAHTTKSRHAIFIHNAGTDRLLIESLQIDDSSSYAYFGREGTDYIDAYDSLAPGATTGMNGPILLTLEAPDTGTYDINLTLNYVIQQARKQGTVPTSSSYTYAVVAHRLPPVSASVSDPGAPATTDFTLMPNPARDEVTIELPNNGTSTVEIYDVLGNLLLHRVAQGSFVWNGTSNNRAVANGTYIVCVGQGSHTSSQRLVIVR